jgi:DNA-binding response OmpR family regulator
MRIAVVEDNPIVRGTLSDLLEYAGHTPSLFWEGWAFLDLVILDENTPIPNVFDLAIIDMALPTVTGVQIIDTLTKIYPQLPIIVISAGTRKYLEDIKQRYPRLDIVQKPFRWSDLSWCIERAEPKKRGAK